MSLDLSAFKHRRILVVGDLMLDEYLWGSVERISPEAPVPVVRLEDTESRPGGAANAARNLAALGAKVALAGVVGADEEGSKLIATLDALGVERNAVLIDPGRPTVRKSRVLAGGQQLLRIDREETESLSRALWEEILARTAAVSDGVDAVLLSDYGKGVAVPELCAELASRARRRGAPAVADPKGRDFSKYAGFTLLTPNRAEALLAAGVETKGDQALFSAGTRLVDTVGVEHILVTCGAEGMVLFSRGEKPRRFTTRPRQVFDVSGAGDTAAAAVTLALASGFPLPRAIEIANAAAGIVVGKIGTETATREELAVELSEKADPAARKRKSLEILAGICADLRRQGKRLVFTNGCFDLLHAGHIRLLAASRALGDLLIVAVDDDASVRALKGPGRPVIGVEQRVRLLAALDSVDYVLVFSTGELEAVIAALRPDVLTKGGDYGNKPVVGGALVESWGGRVVLIPFEENISSTRLIEKIRNT
ncbi:MAG: D-glycero-beta-D-manno-heptose-7-phosphate kinase [Desulfobacterales bacterium]